MRDCKMTKDIWLGLIHVRHKASLFNLSWSQWLDLNLIYLMGRNCADWQAFWAIACYKIWQSHNQKIHNLDFVLPGNLVNDIKLSTTNYYRAMALNQKVVAKPISSIQNGWKSADNGWLTINTKEGVTKNQNARYDGVIRNHKGDWISGFSRNAGTCDIFQVEFWGVFEGFKLAYSSVISKVEFQVNGMEVAKALTSAKDSRKLGLGLIRSIQANLLSLSSVHIKIIRLETNKCTNSLGKHSLAMSSDFCNFANCLLFLLNVIKQDALEGFVLDAN